MSRPTVSLWRKRFSERGIAGLHNEIKPGRPRSTSEERIAKLIKTALQTKPKGKTHWSRRTLADATRLSKSTVHRYLTLFGVQPHRSRSFKLSTDPFFIEKVRDIVGLYLNPPDHALVLCGKRAKCRLWSAPSRCCRWAWVMSKASPTTTCDTARRRCLPLWTSPMAAC